MARQVLIVDDSLSMRQLLAQAVTAGAGDVEIAEALDGLDAIKHLATGRFDLVFIDVNLPMVDGLKIIQRVRAAPQHRGTRICVVTTEAETEPQARQLGADYFLRKPVNRREIERVLAEVLGAAAGGASP